MLAAPRAAIFQGEVGGLTPFLYVTDHPDPGVAEAVRRGRQRDLARFGWSPEEVADPQDPASREASVLRWEERDHPPHRDVLAWYRELLALRRREPALRDARQGSVEAWGDDRAGTVVVRRGDVVVVADVGGAGGPVRIDGAEEELAASPGSRLAGGHAVLAPGGAVVAVRRRPVPAWSTCATGRAMTTRGRRWQSPPGCCCRVLASKVPDRFGVRHSCCSWPSACWPGRRAGGIDWRPRAGPASGWSPAHLFGDGFDADWRACALGPGSSWHRRRAVTPS